MSRPYAPNYDVEDGPRAAVRVRSTSRPPTLRLKGLGKKGLLSTLIATRRITPEFMVDCVLRMIRVRFAPTGEKGVGKVSICRYKGGADAACCISIDFDHPHANPEKTLRNHMGTLALLALSERYNIPLTWAVCGATALADRVAYRHILESKVSHDIGVHTFSHRDFGDPGCSDEEAELEILACSDVLGISGRPTTFVFPWNHASKYQTLQKHGFTAYRSQRRQLGYPVKEHGLWKIPPVYYFDEKSFGADGLVKRFVDLSLAYNCVLHLWSHPWSLSVDGDVKLYFEKTLEPVFQYLAKKRDDGRLWICTMRELANYCEAREKCEILDYDEGHSGFRFSVRSRVDDRFDLPPEVAFRIPINNHRWSVRVKDGGLAENVRLSTHANESGWLYLHLPFNPSKKTVEILYDSDPVKAEG